jgi:hypothetical protein
MWINISPVCVDEHSRGTAGAQENIFHCHIVYRPENLFQAESFPPKQYLAV